MKRFLLILAALFAALIAIRLCPLLLVPTAFALLALAATAVLVIGLLTVTSPLWIAILAGCGFVAIVRRLSRNHSVAVGGRPV